MEAVLSAQSADELADALQRSGSSIQILRATMAGVLPIAVGAGVCLCLSLHFLVRPKERAVHKALLCAIGGLSLASCLVLAVDLGYLTMHLDSVADGYRTDSISILLAFFLTALSSHLARLLFIRRAYVLTGRRFAYITPLLGTAHAALLLQAGLDIYGFLQPVWDASTEGADLTRVKQWWGTFLPIRSRLQVVWAMTSLVSDLMICITIIVSLLRLRTFFDRTKGVINRLILLITQSMLPPMILSVIYAGVVLSGTQTRGSGLRCIAAVQALCYWYAVVSSLRTRRHFLTALEPPRAPTQYPNIPMYSPESEASHPSAPRTPDLEHGTAVGVVQQYAEMRHDADGAVMDGKLLVDIERSSVAGFYDGLEVVHIVTIDDDSQSPDRTYPPEVTRRGEEGRDLSFMK